MARRHKKEQTSVAAAMPAFLNPARDLLVFGVLAFALFFKILLGTAWLWEDMLMFSYPLRVFASTSLAMGQFPLWNPYTFNGMPFFADIQTSVLYLPALLLTLFVKNNTLSFYWLELMVILHYVLAGWGMYRLSLSYGLERVASIFAGAAFMLSGFMITHAIHQQVITLVAWYPLIFLSFRRMLQRKGWRWAGITALLVGHSILAGFPQLSLYLFLFLGSYTVWHLLVPPDGRRVVSRETAVLAVKALAMVALAVGLAAVQLLPSMELAPLSQRAAITYEKATEGSLAPEQVFTLIFPKLFGTAGAQSYSFWGPGPYWHFWETCVYLGILPLFLAALAVVLRPKEKEPWFFTAYGVFSLLFAFGGHFPLHRLFFEYVPQFSTFRDPARMGIFLSFAVSMLAAFSLDALARGAADAAGRMRARSVAVGLGIFSLGFGIAVIAGMLDGSFPFMKNPQVGNLVRSTTTTGVVFIAASAVLVLTMLLSGKAAAWQLYAAVAVASLDLLVFSAGLNDSANNPAQYFGRPASLVRFLHAEEAKGPLRINTRNGYGMLMDRNQGMIDRVQMVEGYTPLMLQRGFPPFRTEQQRFDLLNVRYMVQSDPGRGGIGLVPNPTAMPRAYFMYDVRVLPSDDAVLAAVADTSWNHLATAYLDHDPGITLTRPQRPPAWSARITRYENNLVAVSAESSENGLLVLGEIYYPGWEATVDGRPAEVLRVNAGLRGIALEAGAHDVVVTFVSPPVRRGALISLAALAICAAGIVLSGRPFKRGDTR
jgi:hypothetical protein